MRRPQPERHGLRKGVWEKSLQEGTLGVAASLTPFVQLLRGAGPDRDASQVTF